MWGRIINIKLGIQASKHFICIPVTSCSVFIKNSPSLRGRYIPSGLVTVRKGEVIHWTRSYFDKYSLALCWWPGFFGRKTLFHPEWKLFMSLWMECKASAGPVTNVFKKAERNCLPLRSECHRYDRGEQHFSNSYNKSVSLRAYSFLCLPPNFSQWQMLLFKVSARKSVLTFNCLSDLVHRELRRTLGPLYDVLKLKSGQSCLSYIQWDN